MKKKRRKSRLLDDEEYKQLQEKRKQELREMGEKLDSKMKGGEKEYE